MMDEAKRSRVTKGVPTGGEFATEAKGENGDLPVDAPTDWWPWVDSMRRGERNTAIFDMTQRFIHSGVLTPRPGGFVTLESPLGKDQVGGTMRGGIKLSWDERPARTVDLEDVEGCWTMTFNANVVDPGRRQASEVGSMDTILRDEKDADLAELARLSRRNHLNQLTPGTKAQMAQEAQIRIECTEPDGRLFGSRYQALCAKEIPDDRGYKYGSGWLVRELDPVEVERAINLFEKVATDFRTKHLGRI